MRLVEPRKVEVYECPKCGMRTEDYEEANIHAGILDYLPLPLGFAFRVPYNNPTLQEIGRGFSCRVPGIYVISSQAEKPCGDRSEFAHSFRQTASIFSYSLIERVHKAIANKKPIVDTINSKIVLDWFLKDARVLSVPEFRNLKINLGEFFKEINFPIQKTWESLEEGL